MERLKKIVHNLLFPPVAIVLLFVPIAALLLIYAFACKNANEILVYFSYVFSAYSLTIVCTKSPMIFKQLKQIKNSNKYIQLYSNDAKLRVNISLYSSAALNLLYALLQLFSGFFYHSIWFYALSGYYAILAVIRIFLLKDTRKMNPGKNKLYEYSVYRLCGIFLLFMNITLSIIMTYIVLQNRGFSYHYIYTIALAAYTFSQMTLAIMNVIKYRRFQSPILSAARVISLVSTLVSMISLETAMISAFGEENNESFRQIMTALSGAGICILVLALAMYMIIHASKAMNQIRKGETKIYE